MTDKLNLNQFTGTMNYYEGYLSTSWTDGIVYLARNGCSWIITDICSVVKVIKECKKEDFIAIRLKQVDKDKTVATYTDGNEKELYKQEYKYTDIWSKTGLDELVFYFTNNVLMLSSEY